MQLNHTSPTPLYYQLRQQIRNQIMDGTLPYGSLLPSEPKLASELQLSRATIKQAYDGLVKEGLVTRKQGRGTYVSYEQSEFNVIQEPNFYELVDKNGVPQSAYVLESGYIPADEHVGKKLQVTPGTEVCYFKRVRNINNSPSIIQSVYIRREYAGNLLDADLSMISFHKYIEETNGIELNCFDMIVNAIVLDSYEQDIMKVQKEIPGFRFYSVYWHDNIPAVYNERVFRGDSIRLGLKFAFNRKTEDSLKVNEFVLYEDHA